LILRINNQAQVVILLPASIQQCFQVNLTYPHYQGFSITEYAESLSQFAIIGDQICRNPVKNYLKGSWKG